MKLHLGIPCLALIALAVVFTVGCGPKKQTSPVAGATSEDSPMEAELARTLKEQADFYVFKTATDLPTDLRWEDGMDLPVFADPNAKKGGTFNYFLSDFPRTLRTVGPDSSGAFRAYLRDNTEPFIVDEHPNLPGAVIPGLAHRWALSTGTNTAYYRIDPDARWSDGRPLTTADVVFTFFFYRSPHLRAPWYNDFYTANYRQLIIYDARTFALVHPENKPDLIARFGGFAPYPRHAFGDFGPGWIDLFQWRNLPRLGAYVILDKDVEKGRSITLTRQKDWWAAEKRFNRGRFNPDRYRFEVIRDPDKAVEAFARGDLDFMPLSTPKYWYDTLSEKHAEVAAGRIVRFKFYNRVPQPDWGLWINSSKPLLNNLDIRLGIHHAVDFDLVCRQYFRGDAERLQTRSDGYGWRPHPTIGPRPFDPLMARGFFARAGFDRPGADGVLTNEAGQRLSLTLTTGRQDMRDMLPILKQEAVKAGLELKLEVLDATTGFKKVQEKNHEIALLALNRAVELYPRYWERYHGSNAYVDAYTLDGKSVTVATGSEANPRPQQVKVQTNNMTMTFIPELDRLIEAYDRSETLEEMKRLAEQIEAVIHADAAWVPGWKVPFYRGAYWRHIKWPEGFNVMRSTTADRYFLHWIDVDEKEGIAAARRTGRTYPAELQVFDQFKEAP